MAIDRFTRYYSDLLLFPSIVVLAAGSDMQRTKTLSFPLIFFYRFAARSTSVILLRQPLFLPTCVVYQGFASRGRLKLLAAISIFHRIW